AGVRDGRGPEAPLGERTRWSQWNADERVWMKHGDYRHLYGTCRAAVGQENADRQGGHAAADAAMPVTVRMFRGKRRRRSVRGVGVDRVASMARMHRVLARPGLGG